MLINIVSLLLLSAFDGYWNQGKAEITSYDLKQARYGEVHDGHAVLVFVTEPFSATKQVKLDNPSTPGAVPVLKLNFTRKFNTGIYPYSMMTSVFAPVAGGAPIKVTSTSQEWCGHTFMQLNRRGAGYEGRLYSYFEAEGDVSLSIPEASLEDAIWTTIRLGPKALPKGQVKLLPSATFLRLKHKPARLESAQTTLTKVGGHMRYVVEYRDLDRRLTIDFESSFPHRILGWTEQSGGLTTQATRKKSMMSDYWNRNRKADSKLRGALGLD